MIKPYASKQAAIRYAVATYGQHWPEHARFLEVRIPDSDSLYLIAPKPMASADPSSIEEPASKPITELGAIKRMHAIFALMRKAYPKATRKDLLDECVRQGLKRSTAATQYNLFKLSITQANSPIPPATH